MKVAIVPTIALILSLPVSGQTIEELKNPELREAIARVRKLEDELKVAKQKVRVLSGETQSEPGPEKSERLIDRIGQAVTVPDNRSRDISQGISENPVSALKIRQSVKDPSKAALPATFQLTSKEGKSIKSIDLGIAYERDFDMAAGQPNLSWGILGEYHYLTKSETSPNGVNTMLLGGSLDWYPSTTVEGDAQNIRATLAYKRDRIVSGKGVIGDVSWFPNFPDLNIGDAYFGNDITRGVIEANFRPYIGLQYEEGNGASGFRDGDRTSVRAGVSLGLTILPAYLGNRLTLDNKLSYWEHLDSSGVYSSYDSEQWYLTSKLTYWFYTPKKGNIGDILSPDEQHVGLSLGYNWGDNPEEGKLDMNMITLGLAVKY